ncbi:MULTISPECIES: DUF4439 domain-containing protein [unclassified Frankia]|uniref:DUF4439 domain-containing protein n=1 Tax=unclassified Frankia TaxID=2632575 RepID=UPI001EF49282|nr:MULTISPECIES: DUF4439 domain-containing protein [unclassified Frankia]
MPAPRQRPPAPDTVQTLSNLLAVEHAAVYAAAAAGGELAPLRSAAESTRVLAENAFAAHRELRDRLVAEILDRGGTAPPAQAAYQLPALSGDLAGVLLLLAGIEDRSSAAAYDAIGELTGEMRALVTDALTGMAVRGQQARVAAGQPVAQASRALPGA